jgi:sensor histidine kinase YesM
MKSKKRRRLFIDRPVQGGLIRRTVIYWILCMLVVTNMAICWLVVPKNPSSFGEFVAMTYDVIGPVLTTSVFVVPLIIFDCVRMSNRFAGPVYRLHREIKRIADGQEAAPIQLRKGDHWQEIADDFNRMLERIKQEESYRQAKGDEGVKTNSYPVDSELHAIAP